MNIGEHKQGVDRDRLVFSCSGCSSAAQMANWLAVEIDREGLAEMSSTSAVCSGVEPIVQRAKVADLIVAIDGCALHCARRCLEQGGLEPHLHYELGQYGVQKTLHGDFDVKKAQKILSRLKDDLALTAAS